MTTAPFDDRIAMDQLIDTLSRDVRPVSRHALSRRMGVGMAAGAALVLALIAALLGFRPDLVRALAGGVFWMKWSYAASLAAIAFWGVSRLARPASGPMGRLGWLVVPLLALSALSVVEMARTPRSQWLALWLGRSWSVCPWLVFGLSIPILLGLAWSFRRFAPTRLRTAGAVAGLCSGACAAMLYCLHCPETSALFVLTWYSLGMVLATALGAAAGPRLLRW